MSAREYVRVYYEIVDDEKFHGLTLEQYGGWLRLLLIADASWPASGYLPSSNVVPDDVVDELVLRGIVDLAPGGRYRIHGLDKERDYRRRSATRGSDARWSDRMQPSNAAASAPQMRLHTEGRQKPNAVAMPSKDEQSKDEQSTTRAGLLNFTDVCATAWEQATGRTVLASGNWAATYVDDAIRRHGPEKVAAAIVVARSSFTHIPEPAALAAAVRQRLDPLPDAKASAATQRAGEEEKAAAAAARRNQVTLLRARHNSGMHADAEDNQCPLCSSASSTTA